MICLPKIETQRTRSLGLTSKGPHATPPRAAAATAHPQNLPMVAPSVLTLIDERIIAAQPTLPQEFERCGRALEVVPVHRAAATPLVRWTLDDAELPHAALVMTGAELVARANAGDLLGTSVAGLPPATLVAVGPPPPRLEPVLDAVQLECGISVRRVLNAVELADLLVALGSALSRAAYSSACGEVAFLSGLTSRDVLFNQKVPRGLSEAWLGALKQLLPERAASAVHTAFPTSQAIYQHYREAADPQGAIADLRVGNQRFGPCKSRRLHRILMATREQSEEIC